MFEQQSRLLAPPQPHSFLLPACLVSMACVVQPLCAKPAARSLAEAVMRKDRSAVEALFDAKADVNAGQPDGMTAVHWAAYHDNAELTARLLAAGASAKTENRYGVTPLAVACTNGNGAIVEMLLKAGADPNAKLQGGETALMTAARTGKLRPVTALVQHGADVNAKERKGQTALMWAAAEGNDAVVDALIAAGADVQASLSSGFTPFFFAAREGKTKVLLRLLEAGVDVNAAMQTKNSWNKSPKQGTSALMLAVENGHFELASALLDRGADPNDQRLGFTALHAMSWVRKPIRGDGNPPPIGSGNLSSLQFVRKIVASGADVNARHKLKKRAAGRLTLEGATPFLLAATTADLPLMKLLLELGADPELANVDNSTPLLAAVGVDDLSSGDQPAATEVEALAAARLLLDLGADINVVDDNGETVMHGAAYKSSPKMIQLLVANGADQQIWDKKNKYGWTPLAIAQGHRHGNFRPSAETTEALQAVMPKTKPVDVEPR